MITLTKEIIEKARDYIPIERKHTWCRNVAIACVKQVPVTGNGNEGAFTLPDRWEENTMARQMALASALAQNYLGIWSEEDVLQAVDYDEIMGSHLINQMERLKSDKEIRDKVFNVMYDYNELKKMLNSEIYSRLGHLNDTLSRMLVALQAQDPEKFKDMAEQAQELSLAVKEWESKKAGRIAGDMAKAKIAAKKPKKQDTDKKTETEN